jgi:Flp pilus assembly protein TadG
MRYRRNLSERRARRERGHVLIESALLLMVVLGLIIGTCDFGQFLYLHQSLSERARAAARYGAVNSYSWPGTEIKNVAVYNNPNPSNNTAAMVNDLTPDMVSAELIGDGTGAARVRVTITGYRFNFFSPWIAKRATAKDIIASVPYEHGL